MIKKVELRLWRIALLLIALCNIEVCEQLSCKDGLSLRLLWHCDHQGVKQSKGRAMAIVGAVSSPNSKEEMRLKPWKWSFLNTSSDPKNNFLDCPVALHVIHEANTTQNLSLDRKVQITHSPATRCGSS